MTGYDMILVEPNTRTYCGPVGSERRTAGRRGGAGLDTWTPSGQSGQETTLPPALQRIEDIVLEGSTNKRNPTWTDGGTKSAFEPQ